MKQKNILKWTAATVTIIGAGTVLFHALAETTFAAGVGKAEKVPTSYPVLDNLETALQEVETNEESSLNADCHVSMDDLNTGTPTDMDLTMEEAAEEGARYLKKIFGLDLKGAYVYMMYDPGTETFPRAFWSGDVLFEKEQTPESTRWSFLIDAVTGELFNIGYGRNLDVEVPLDYDESLEQDYSVYAELAKKKVEECGLLSSPVDRVEYGCQGYGGNDPDISVHVIGENGEVVNMCFSRYDQMFLGMITDASLKITESALDSADGEVEYFQF